jgi:predicted RNA-binding Zn-ribbon protein involved in translation (DUF1610 family)
MPGMAGPEETVQNGAGRRKGLDSLFGRIAMGMGHVTPEQVRECIQEQDRARAAGKEAAPPRLGEIMHARGMITAEQRDEILLMQEAMLARKTQAGKGPSVGEMLLGQVAVREGFVARRQLERCLAIQARETEQGRHPRLGKIMLKLGYLRPEDLRLLLMMQNRTLMQCVSCNTRYNVEGHRSDKRFLCKHCGSELRICTDQEHVAADDTIVFELLREIEDQPE